MPTSLQGIAKKAQEQKQYRFRNLYGMLNEELLRASWREIKKHAAYGVDQISAQDYAQNLEENIRALVERLKQAGGLDQYRTKTPSRSVLLLTMLGGLIAVAIGLALLVGILIGVFS